MIQTLTTDLVPTVPPVDSRAEHGRLALRLYDVGRPLATALADGSAVEPARRAAGDFLAGTLLPHLEAEERTLRHAQRRVETRLLARALFNAQRTITARATEFLTADPPWEAVAAFRTLHTVFSCHATTFDDVLLPVLRLQEMSGTRRWGGSIELDAATAPGGCDPI